jgi:hypothetical protein
LKIYHLATLLATVAFQNEKVPFSHSIIELILSSEAQPQNALVNPLPKSGNVL